VKTPHKPNPQRATNRTRRPLQKKKAGKKRQGRGKNEKKKQNKKEGRRSNREGEEKRHQSKEDEGKREATKRPTLLPCVATGFWFSLWRLRRKETKPRQTLLS
jgi:hypothetical protein